MPTKKDLEERYGISRNTVRKTLEACGLDTAREDYSDEEINGQFETARRLLTDEKKTYKEVADHFGVTFHEDVSPEQGNTDESQRLPRDIDGGDPLGDTVRSNVASYVQEVADEAVQDAIQQLPQMIVASAQRAVRSGVVDGVFQQMMEQRRAFQRETSFGGPTINVSAGGLPFSGEDDDQYWDDNEEG